MMDDERNKILQMLKDGQITPEEANDLLGAVEPDTAPAAAATAAPAPGESPAPDMLQFRRYWQIPFGIGAALVGVGWLLVSRAEGFFGGLFGWLFLLLGGAVTVVGWQSRYFPWLHVRIEEKDGNRITISLPLPLGLAQWGLNIARRYVDAGTAEHLDTASAMLDSLKDQPTGEPLSVEVSEDDGDHVQVFFG